MWDAKLVIITNLFLVPLVYCQNRIVGGSPISIEKAPYQISLRLRGIPICGGALISDKYGLSAGHCFPLLNALYSVRVGSDRKYSGGVLVNLKTVFLHPKHTKYNHQYDIAILEFAHPVTTKIQPAQLPKENDVLATRSIGLITGFGNTLNDKGTGSPVLMGTEVIVRDLWMCQKEYRSINVEINERVFCAGDPKGIRDSCQGDSGGPFVVNNILYGLVSFGMDCGDPNYPGVYTNVSHFRNFIRLNTGI